MANKEDHQQGNKDQQQEVFILVSGKDSRNDAASSPFVANCINEAADDKKMRTRKANSSNLFINSSITLLFAAQMCNNFGWYALLVEFPNLIKYIIGYDYITDRQNVLLSFAPYLSMCIFCLFWTFSLDLAWNRGYINIKTVRQLSTGTGYSTTTQNLFFAQIIFQNIELAASLLPAACYIGGVGLITGGWDRRTVLTFSTIGTMFMAGAYCSIITKSNCNEDETVNSSSSLIAFVPGFIVPVFEVVRPHQPIDKKNELKHWQLILFATAGVLTFKIALYTFMNFIPIEI